jgi:hypothetical protein
MELAEASKPRLISPKEAEGRGALGADRDGTNYLVPRVFAHGTVMTDGLDVENASVGCEAELPQ